MKNKTDTLSRLMAMRLVSKSGFSSVRDIAEARGMNIQMIRNLLAEGLRRGLVEVSFELRPSISGIPRRVPVYKIKPMKGTPCQN